MSSCCSTYYKYSSLHYSIESLHYSIVPLNHSIVSLNYYIVPSKCTIVTINHLSVKSFLTSSNHSPVLQPKKCWVLLSPYVRSRSIQGHIAPTNKHLPARTDRQSAAIYNERTRPIGRAISPLLHQATPFYHLHSWNKWTFGSRRTRFFTQNRHLLFKQMTVVRNLLLLKLILYVKDAVQCKNNWDCKENKVDARKISYQERLASGFGLACFVISYLVIANCF